MLESLCTNLHEISGEEQKVNTNSLYKDLENTTDYGLCYKARGQTSGDLFTQQIFIEPLF